MSLLHPAGQLSAKFRVHIESMRLHKLRCPAMCHSTHWMEVHSNRLAQYRQDCCQLHWLEYRHSLDQLQYPTRTDL